MWSNLRIVQANLFRLNEQFYQTKRTVFILKRRYPLMLGSLGRPPKKIRERGYLYDVVEDTDSKSAPLIDVVLTANVPGVGMRGEKISMNPFLAYRDLLLPQLALYADLPEAKSILKSSEEIQYSSKYSRIVQNYLADQAVKIILSNDVSWTLKPWHVKFALRNNGIVAKEECIKIPNEISGPNPEIENKDFIIYLTMNKTDEFPLRCRIYHWSSMDPTLNQKLLDIDSDSEPLFPDEKEMIVSLIKGQQEVRRNRMIRGEGNEKKVKKKYKVI